MTDASSLPSTPIDFDLDAAERPAKDIKPPFVVKLGGRPVTMKDPGELDWQDLAVIQQPTDFLEFSVDEDDRDHVLNQEMPGWKLNALMERYMQHFGLDARLRQAEREQRRGR